MPRVVYITTAYTPEQKTFTRALFQLAEEHSAHFSLLVSSKVEKTNIGRKKLVKFTDHRYRPTKIKKFSHEIVEHFCLKPLSFTLLVREDSILGL